MERLAFVFETSWNFYELEQSLQEIPELSVSPLFEDYFSDNEYLPNDRLPSTPLRVKPEFEECIEEPEVKQVSRFFRAIRNWLEVSELCRTDENPLPSDVVMVHPGGWIF